MIKKMIDYEFISFCNDKNDTLIVSQIELIPS